MLPEPVSLLTTTFALAVWYMDGGHRHNQIRPHIPPVMEYKLL